MSVLPLGEGTYRVIYRIDDKARVVTVVDVAHRRDAYRT
jgi:mRNA interferase RelE/StbE